MENGALKTLLRISSSFPALPVESSASRYASWFGANPKKYASFAFLAPLLPALAIALYSFASSPLLIPAFLLVYALSSSLILLLPKLAFNGIKSTVETELPLFLRTLGMLLELNLPFHGALKRLSKEDFAISPYLRIAVQETERGASIESALAQLAAGFESLPIKRAFSQVLCAYESGEGAREVLEISNDLFLLSSHKARESSSKQALSSLLFIAASTILPAVFLIFSVLGKTIFSSEVSELEFSLAFLLGFPALSACILAATTSFSSAGPLEGKSRGQGFLPPLLIALIAVSCTLAGLEPALTLLILLAALIISIALSYPSYKKDKYRESVESGLPDALLSASASRAGTNAESAIFRMKKSSTPELSAELSISLKQMRANVAPARALEDLWERNDSPILRRVSNFLCALFDSGADAHRYMGLMAEDIFRLFELRRQRQNALSIQKYTLVFGALILPVILGNSLSLISGISETAGTSEPLLATASTLIPAYLIIYAFLSSSFIAAAESRQSATLAYFASLSVASTILFYLFLGTVTLHLP
ncbi:type II secretion system F family protein [Candidatus Micrarchaeota archaeon]|nr:type II secretion system F family protein [Candidatus Micrarchaeota archaeon]